MELMKRATLMLEFKRVQQKIPVRKVDKCIISGNVVFPFTNACLLFMAEGLLQSPGAGGTVLH